MSESQMSKSVFTFAPSSEHLQAAPLSFLPREKAFWVVNVLAWVLVLETMNLGGDSLLRLLRDGKPLLFWVALAWVWLAYVLTGLLAVLLFRHLYYRRQWGEHSLIASLPLLVLIAAAAGMSLSLVVHLPVDAVLEEPLPVFELGGQKGSIGYALYRGVSLTVLFLFWLFLYWVISASLTARRLSYRTLALESELKTARLNALTAQINPHFLFNALNNIRFMIARDATRAEESLVALSDILRHALDSSRKQKVLLAEELAIARRYLELMKNQMAERLEYSIEAGHAASKHLVPPMIVQMLAENAIKHGVERLRQGGHVAIRCSLIAGTLRIEVINSMPSGAAAGTSGEHDQNTPEPSDIAGSPGPAQGIGLMNIGKRLDLLYGNRATLTVSQQDEHFRVLIELPGEKTQ